ncbi:MAG: alpha/beta fold hydrolase [Nitrospirae bacterium]|nr:alpha/beta fold hydrolase [Nitrospirota bacterium]MDA1305107.1 alpha/beta fold hydrolase [Nitrospirota bacterium]
MNTNPASIPFLPNPWLANPHVQTLMPRYRRRNHLLVKVPVEERLFQVDSQSQIKSLCSWQDNRNGATALILVHGLEGCHESHYMRGLAHKAWHAGFNVIRFNQRNCADTEHLTPTLYHGGLSQDIRSVADELVGNDGIRAIWLTGYSMGGNLVLKMAGEARDNFPALQGVAAVCPNIHPAGCVAALEQRRNWIYHEHFMVKLKARLQRKAKLFPGRWDLSLYKQIRTMSQFDDAYTAPDGGYRDAADYYEQTGSRHVLEHIQVPTLIITSQDDPFIPIDSFNIPAIHASPHIRMLAPTHGGHCGFIQKSGNHEDGHWAENRIVEFIRRT